jgi:hypothetical protein
MLDRAEECFGLRPRRLAADTAYGTGKFLGWLVKKKKIIPHIPVWEKSDRQDGIFSRSHFHWDTGILGALTAGRHPIELTPTRLLRLSKNLPHDWKEQRRFLGFAA